MKFSETERQNLLEWYAADYQFLDLCKRLLAQENRSTEEMKKLVLR
ncbi:hypothetical protein H6F51_13885 [Cyanobacteria bacterium FACHB-DQ100]|nr:hypothetical protein [Cyanobacteria bacterium FACHB-DQ100]